jgi:hypothetical protein
LGTILTKYTVWGFLASFIFGQKLRKNWTEIWGCLALTWGALGAARSLTHAARRQPTTLRWLHPRRYPHLQLHHHLLASS